MVTVIKKWGNASAIRLPANILKELNWAVNENIDIKIQDNKLILEKSTKRKNILELFENYEGDYKCTEIDWGESIGEEIW